MYHLELSREELARRRRRRRRLLAGVVVLVVLLASVGALASLEEPDLYIDSMWVQRIDMSTDTVYVTLRLTVYNPNRVQAHLTGVEGTVTSGGQRLDTFSEEELAVIPSDTNLTVDVAIRIDDAPMPMPGPMLQVKGKARVRMWMMGLTYHYDHSIPLTHSPDADNRPPVAQFEPPLFARRGHPVTFDGTTSYDPDGRVVGWLWDFGDGLTAEGPVVDHTFSDRGVFEVTLTVVDQMGERSRATDSLRVLPV